MTDLESVRANALRVLERCAEAAARSGRRPEDVTVVAACKTHPLEMALAAAEAGIHCFGENRVQEAQAKWSRFDRGELQLHMIGRLQRNKAAAAVRLFDCIQSCDSVPLAQRLSRVATGQVVRVLLEVNVGGEESKAGFPPSDLCGAIAGVLELPGLDVRGLMTIAPRVHVPEAARRYYRLLRALSQELRASFPRLGPELSMGMTGDYEVAIEEGATMVRIGRAIFGERDLLAE